MTLLSILVFLPPILAGILIVHLLWPERGWKAVWVKVFLGIGLGLGQASLLDFIYMLLFSNENGFLFVQLALFVGLLIDRHRSRKKKSSLHFSSNSIEPLANHFARGIIDSNHLICVERGQCVGARAARRVGRVDDVQPRRALHLSRPARLVGIVLAANGSDLPRRLSIATWHGHCLGVASGWSGNSTRTPIVLSGLFMLACAGLLGASLNLTKSLGQASIGLILLLGSSLIGNEGACATSRSSIGIFFSWNNRIDLFICHIEEAGVVDIGGLYGWSRGVDKE